MSRDQERTSARDAILILRVARLQERNANTQHRLDDAILDLCAQSGRRDLVPDWLRLRAAREGLLP